MKRLLLDANVVLDFVLERPPFAVAARALWARAERKELEAFMPAPAATTVFYVVARLRGNPFATRVMSDLLTVPAIAAVDGAVLRRALALRWPDFEDAVCAAAAEAAACDVIVTRDPKGYPESPILAVDPLTALSMLGGSPGPEEVAERPSRRARFSRRGRIPRHR